MARDVHVGGGAQPSARNIYAFHEAGASTETSHRLSTKSNHLQRRDYSLRAAVGILHGAAISRVLQSENPKSEHHGLPDTTAARVRTAEPEQWVTAIGPHAADAEIASGTTDRTRRTLYRSANPTLGS